MGKDNVVALPSPEGADDPLTERLRTSAKRLIQQAFDADLAGFLAEFAVQVNDHDRRAVVRNGYLSEREIQTDVGPVPIRVPRVRKRTAEPVVFLSSLASLYVRMARRVETALP